MVSCICELVVPEECVMLLSATYMSVCGGNDLRKCAPLTEMIVICSGKRFGFLGAFFRAD
mgnify:CR=1 FL=1